VLRMCLWLSPLTRLLLWLLWLPLTASRLATPLLLSLLLLLRLRLRLPLTVDRGGRCISSARASNLVGHASGAHQRPVPALVDVAAGAVLCFEVAK